MPGRILLLLILVAIVVLAFRRLRRSPTRPADKRTTTGRMVQCAACGLYLPEQEAIVHHGKYYCSPSHRDGSGT